MREDAEQQDKIAEAPDAGMRDDRAADPGDASDVEEKAAELESGKPPPEPTVEELMGKLKEAQDEIENLNRRYLRALADYDNARKRAQAERASLRSAVICDFVASLLPVIDNLDRAIEMGEGADAQAMVDGLKMVRQQIADVLKSEGICCIEAVGNQFDPNKHDAVMQVELDGYDDNVVVEELQRGYEAEGRVIRPSLVKVNRARA
ncbi:MAG: nucleotide exchange factor GrpE [Firmicutes bacterium]|mgnify:CR=1 FL=1|nr:nucleotide exchange factor GrpE [Bacillota bacterium]